MGVWEKDLLSNSKKSSIAVFSKIMSELYDHSWYGKLSSDEVDYFFSLIGEKPALEIASGTGRISLPLLHKGCDLHGLEGSSNMLNHLYDKLSPAQKERFILWDALRIPYPARDEVFESIIVPFSTFGLIHNNVSDLGENKLFHEFYRLLQSGGLLIINDYRTKPFDRNQVIISQPPWVHQHVHPHYGAIREEQTSRFVIVPNTLLPEQIIRERRTRLIIVEDGELLEEFFEAIPIWDTLDFPVLGENAGFRYIKGELCNFHEDPSINHIFRKC